MHHNALPLAGDGSVSACHVDGHVFMRAEHHLGHGLALGLQTGHFIDQGHMVGAQVGKQIADTGLLQTLQKVTSRGVFCFRRGRIVHR